MVGRQEQKKTRGSFLVFPAWTQTSLLLKLPSVCCQLPSSKLLNFFYSPPLLPMSLHRVWDQLLTFFSPSCALAPPHFSHWSVLSLTPSPCRWIAASLLSCSYPLPSPALPLHYWLLSLDALQPKSSSVSLALLLL